jgi:hypothetical protein
VSHCEPDQRYAGPAFLRTVSWELENEMNNTLCSGGILKGYFEGLEQTDGQRVQR